MSAERPTPTPDAFGFTERERLYDRISHARLLTLLADEPTLIHQIIESFNDYGEFLFVTLSRPAGEQRIYRTFWGLGFHEQRERWISDEWRWYEPYEAAARLQTTIAQSVANHLIQERTASVTTADAGAAPQSARGKLFEMLADLTDDDGALTELNDLGWWLLDTPDEEG